ncbi:hypothetical protein EEB14_45105 [Rhodococcus sp. WS4]|nr:hypothetical protein EEB14_45105 [Rhodococcus sp. WS4]
MANPHRLTTDQVIDSIKEETDVHYVRTLAAGPRKRRRYMRFESEDRTLIDDTALGYARC